MSPQDNEKITINMKILTLIIATVISVMGWIINTTLNAINDNIKEIKIELKELNSMSYDNQSRIKVLEEKIKK